jgi:tight adherence protein B
VNSLFADLPEEWPLLIGAALVLVLIAESVYLLFFNATQYRSNVNRRLEIQKTANSREDALSQLKKERGLDDESQFGLKRRILPLIAQSGTKMGVQRVFLLWALVPMVLPMVALAFDRTAVYELAGALIAGALLPMFVLKYLRAKRVRKFAEQFPDAIDVVVRSLRAGHPLAIAITLVAREMPDPVGTEFGMVGDELSFGLDLETAMRNMYARVGQEDLPLFVTSVSIQAATGGNLAIILEGLSKVIRDRFKMRRKIKALSSEAKFSAYVLISLPFFIFFTVNVSSPDFFDAAKGRPETTLVIIGCFIWMSIGVAVMRKLVNMKI